MIEKFARMTESHEVIHVARNALVGNYGASGINIPHAFSHFSFSFEIINNLINSINIMINLPSARAYSVLVTTVVTIE